MLTSPHSHAYERPLVILEGLGLAASLNRNDYVPLDPQKDVSNRWLGGVAFAGRLVHPSLLFQNEAFLPKARAVSPEPFSRDWFEEASRIRFGRSAAWISHLLEFHKHSGEQVVCIGPTLGSDWVQYAENQAELMVLLPSDPWVRLVQRHFSLRGGKAKFLVQPPGVLPLETSTVDVICWNALNEDSDQIYATAKEIMRVLRPGGKVILLGPSFSNQKGWLGDSPFGWSGPIFTRSMTSKMFEGMVEMRWHQRCLKRSEIHWLIRWLPVSLMQRVVGRCMVFKAFKPLPTIKGKPLGVQDGKNFDEGLDLPGIRSHSYPSTRLAD